MNLKIIINASIRLNLTIKNNDIFNNFLRSFSSNFDKAYQSFHSTFLIFFLSSRFFNYFFYVICMRQIFVFFHVRI